MSRASTAAQLQCCYCCCRWCCCCRCGSYARALQYFETHVRDKHGGGLNPSAFNGGCSSYNYDDVSCRCHDVEKAAGVFPTRNFCMRSTLGLVTLLNMLQAASA
jgi:hypothetical protein